MVLIIGYDAMKEIFKGIDDKSDDKGDIHKANY